VSQGGNRIVAQNRAKRLMKRYGRPQVVAADGLRSYGAALKEIGVPDRQEVGRWGLAG
jgi:putative transposase